MKLAAFSILFCHLLSAFATPYEVNGALSPRMFGAGESSKGSKNRENPNGGRGGKKPEKIGDANDPYYQAKMQERHRKLAAKQKQDGKSNFKLADSSTGSPPREGLEGHRYLDHGRPENRQPQVQVVEGDVEGYTAQGTKLWQDRHPAYKDATFWPADKQTHEINRPRQLDGTETSPETTRDEKLYADWQYLNYEDKSKYRGPEDHRAMPNVFDPDVPDGQSAKVPTQEQRYESNNVKQAKRLANSKGVPLSVFPNTKKTRDDYSDEADDDDSDSSIEVRTLKGPTQKGVHPPVVPKGHVKTPSPRLEAGNIVQPQQVQRGYEPPPLPGPGPNGRKWTIKKDGHPWTKLSDDKWYVKRPDVDNKLWTKRSDDKWYTLGGDDKYYFKSDDGNYYTKRSDNRYYVHVPNGKYYTKLSDGNWFTKAENGKFYGQDGDGNLVQADGQGKFVTQRSDSRWYTAGSDGNQYTKLDDDRWYTQGNDGKYYSRDSDGTLRYFDGTRYFVRHSDGRYYTRGGDGKDYTQLSDGKIYYKDSHGRFLRQAGSTTFMSPDDRSFYYRANDGKWYPAPASKTKRDIGETINSDSTAPTDSYQSANITLNEYKAMYVEAQTNASAACIPFLHDMIAGSNSTIVYDAAWSIYTDIFVTGEQVVGPFKQGMHAFDDIEDYIIAQAGLTEWFSSNFSDSALPTNRSGTLRDSNGVAVANLNNDESNAYMIANVKNMLAVNTVLINKYATAYANCSTAANQTGPDGYALLDYYYLLAEILLDYNVSNTLPIQDGLATWETFHPGLEATLEKQSLGAPSTWAPPLNASSTWYSSSNATTGLQLAVNVTSTWGMSLNTTSGGMSPRKMKRAEWHFSL